MPNQISRFTNNTNPIPEPESSPSRGSITDGPGSPANLSTASTPITSSQAQLARQRALANMRARQQSFATNPTNVGEAAAGNVGEAVVVNPTTMAWARTLIEQGSIPTIAQNIRAQAEPAIAPTGVEQFDQERAIANQNASGMDHYRREARSRLLALENPPTTRQQCDELREQLECYIEDPESYGIRDSDGRCIDLQTQTFRAYSEVLTRGLRPDPIVGTRGGATQAFEALIQMGFTGDQIERIATRPGTGRGFLAALNQMRRGNGAGRQE